MTLPDALVALGAISTLAGLVYGFIRTHRSDAVVERSGVLTENRSGTIQRWEELEAINKVLREDNVALRDERKEHRARLDALEAKLDAVESQLARMQRKYGENGPTEVTT